MGELIGAQRVKEIMKQADKDIRRETFKAVNRAVKPIRDELKTSARKTLPGDLAEWVAKPLTTRTRQAYSGKSVGITVKATVPSKMKGRGKSKRRRTGTFGAKADLGAINRGRVMHPVWGRGPLVGPQMVKAGFFTDVARGPVSDRAKVEIKAALEAVAQKIAGASA